MASTATAPATDRLPMSEIIGLPEFQRLTPQQQIFVSCYISSGVRTGTYDALGSIMKAYNVSMKNAPGLAAQMLGHKKIARILDLHFFGRTDHSELNDLLAVLCKAIKKSIRHDLKYRGTISVATTKALEFFERQTGKSLRRSRGANPPVAEVTEPKVEPASAAAVVPARFAVGDIAILQGKKYRVTAVNPDGSVSEADPLL